MEGKFVHFASRSLVCRLNKHIKKDGIELQKLTIGMEILFINITKLVAIFLFAVAMGTLYQTLIIYTAFAMSKRYTFGLHAVNSTVCTFVSCGLFVLIPYMLTEIGISNAYVAITFSVAFLLIYRYAPADTKARPIIGARLRIRLKKKAMICCGILMVMALTIPVPEIKLLITLGIVYQCIAILPFTYKILKRSEKNYELYENSRFSLSYTKKQDS